MHTGVGPIIGAEARVGRRAIPVAQDWRNFPVVNERGVQNVPLGHGARGLSGAYEIMPEGGGILDTAVEISRRQRDITGHFW
jgi:hypothetical protein